MFLSLTRIRFRPEYNEVPFKYHDDPLQTEIVIDSAYNVESEVIGKKPAIYVQRNDIYIPQVSVDNLSQHDIPHDVTSYYTIVNTTVSFHCISPNRGEVDIIGWMVASFYACSARLLKQAAQLREIKDVAMSTNQPYTIKDKKIWLVNVSVKVAYDLKWLINRIWPMLEDIRINNPLAAEMADIPDDTFFAQLYLSNMQENIINQPEEGEE